MENKISYEKPATSFLTKLLGCLMLFLATFLISTQAEAGLPTPTAVDPHGGVTVMDTNDLVLFDDVDTANPGTVTKHMVATSNMYKVAGSLGTGGLGPSTYINATYAEITSLDWFEAVYPECGTYIDSASDTAELITAVLTFSDIHTKEAEPGVNTFFLFRVADYIQGGYQYNGVGHFTITYEFYWASGLNSGSKIDFSDNNAVLTFSSLNHYGSGEGGEGEFVAPLSMASDGKAYIINSTIAGSSNIGLVSSAATATYPYEAYQGLSNSFTDGNIYATTFHRNSVAIELSGETHRFVIGPTNKFNRAWHATNSISLFRGNPGAPTKDVLDTDLESIDGEEVARGQTLYYDIKQKSAIMPTHISTPWQSLTIYDYLPEEVNYVSAALYESDGTTKITDANAGTFSYNSSTRQVLFTANSTFLNTTCQYKGEEYILRIEVIVANDATNTFTNTGFSNVETLIQETNEVSNYLSNGNLEIAKRNEEGQLLPGVTFSLKDSNGIEWLVAPDNVTDSSGKIEIELYPGVYTLTEVSAPAGYKLDTTPRQITIVKDSVTTIEVINYYAFRIHLRQVVVNSDNEMVIPSSGHFTLTNVDSSNVIAKTFNTTALSSDKNSPTITNSLFTTWSLSLDTSLGYELLDINLIVPEYYNYLGYTVTDNDSSLSVDHISSSTGFVPNNFPQLDYSTKKEYWVTVYIQPKYGDDDDGYPEGSPRPYSWDEITNEFGKIKL